jgi:hypothetical protein
VVRELLGRTETHHPGDAFERVKAAEQLVEQRLLDARLPDLIFEREQMPADERQMLITLGVVIVEKLCEELTIVVGVWSGHEALF